MAAAVRFSAGPLNYYRIIFVYYDSLGGLGTRYMAAVAMYFDEHSKAQPGVDRWPAASWQRTRGRYRHPEAEHLIHY